MLVLLLACENPISNAVFIADEAFITALPGAARLGFPSFFRDRPRDGDEHVLELATDAAADLEPLVTRIVGIGEVLRSTEPAERSPTHRSFAPRTIAAPAGSRADTWWVRAELTRAGEQADVTWTVEGASSPDGPWVQVANGRHDTDGIGTSTFDAPAFAGLNGLPNDHDVLTIDYQDERPDRVRSVEFTFPVSFDLPIVYAFTGDVAFGFTGLLDLREPGVQEPGAATVIVLPGGEGRADAVLDGDVTFTSCWDTAGDRVFASVAGELFEGDPGRCPTLDF